MEDKRNSNTKSAISGPGSTSAVASSSLPSDSSAAAGITNGHSNGSSSNRGSNGRSSSNHPKHGTRERGGAQGKSTGGRGRSASAGRHHLGRGGAGGGSGKTATAPPSDSSATATGVSAEAAAPTTSTGDSAPPSSGRGSGNRTGGGRTSRVGGRGGGGRSSHPKHHQQTTAVDQKAAKDAAATVEETAPTHGDPTTARGSTTRGGGGRGGHPHGVKGGGRGGKHPKNASASTKLEEYASPNQSKGQGGDTEHPSSATKNPKKSRGKPKTHEKKNSKGLNHIDRSATEGAAAYDAATEAAVERNVTDSVEPPTSSDKNDISSEGAATCTTMDPWMTQNLESNAASSTVIASPAPRSLNLPRPPPTGTSSGTPGILILSRSAAGTTTSATAVTAAADQPPKAKAKSKRSKKTKKTKSQQQQPEGDDDEDEDEDDQGKSDALTTPEPELTLTQALEKLPAQQVSITADTQVKILRRSNDSTLSLSDKASSKDVTTSKTQPPKAPKHKKKQKKSDAQRQFNHEVRNCVEKSDPNELRALLRDKHNHQYWLDDSVLEIVLTAYVMAAMFDDALYCLRNCTRPAVLSIYQAEHILSCLPQNLRNSSAYTAADMISQLCVATDFNPSTHRSYFLRIVRGISLEFLEEAMSARDRICTAPCERLVRAGLCVVDARLERGKKASELVVIPGHQLGCFVPEGDQRGIAAGDAVSLLPYAGPYPMSAESLDRNMIEATVFNTNPMILRLQDKTNASLHAMLVEPIEGNVYRIDKLANRMGYNRQLAAAVAICCPAADPSVRDYRRPCPELVKAITAMDENIVSLMRQSKNGLLPKGQLTSTAALCAEAIPWSVEDEGESFDPDASRAAARLALEKYGALEGLNASQRLAVEGATTNRLTLVQGPPGTGKTAVAIRILQHWARLASASAPKGSFASPILATSDSNIAVDNLVEGCAAVGLRVVRLGRPEAIRPELLKYCIDKPPTPYNGNDRQNNSNGLNYPNAGSIAQAHKERVKQLKSAQVICCTCIGSGGDMLDALGPLEHVLVDEATQATEPAVLVPLMRGCRQLVLVGDHCQLPPTVLSTRAEEEGHGVPLFSRMVACGVPPFMLDTQYRMHPCIAMFPSDLFYGGRLNNGVSSAERRPLAGFPWPREEFPVAFVPVKGDELDDGVSKYNEAEAAAACDAVVALLHGGQCGISDIAVVTPYAAQARLIRRQLRRLLPDNGPPYVEVSSVDGFQGREKEAVVFSAVRSNDWGAIGFTSDWRRVNVSFTRARRALIVIGNDQTLRRGDPDTWSPWLAWVDAHGLNMDKPGIPRGRYDPEQLRRVRGGTTAAEMLKDVLERQQAQLKTAEQQQERASRNVRSLMFDSTKNDGGFGEIFMSTQESTTPTRELTLEEDLALMENVDGNWDDSDDEEEVELRHSVSKATLTSACSSNDVPSADESNVAVDIWDL